MGTLSKLPEEAKTACQAAALRYGVSGAVHPSDWIFWFLYNLAIFPSKLAATETYFADGADCACKFRSLIEEQRPVAGARILEFAAGYGRVTRHLRKVVPEAAVLACDIRPDAVTVVEVKPCHRIIGAWLHWLLYNGGGATSCIEAYNTVALRTIEPGLVDLPHPALGQDFTPSPTARRLTR